MDSNDYTDAGMAEHLEAEANGEEVMLRVSRMTRLVLDHLADVLPREIREHVTFRRELNITVAAVCTVEAHRSAGGRLSNDEAESIFHKAIKRLGKIHCP